MKIAITGANGFLGSYLVKESLHQKMEVYAFLRKEANTSLLPQDKNLRILTINYRDNLDPQVEEIKKQTGEVDYFFHNAGLTVSLKNDEYYQINTGLTEKLVTSIQKASYLKPEGTFAYTSSYAAHGPANIQRPVSHYGRSKQKAEEIIKKYFEKYLIARPTAIYGAGDIAFLPLFKTAKMGLYPITRKTQKMSMIHAKDLAHMIIEDLQSQQGTIHYCDGNTYLHRDFIEIFSQLFRKKIHAIPLPKGLAKLSIGTSDIWHQIIKKRPGITLEKFTEISQDWDLHTTELRHSTVRPSITLKEGFEDALLYYKKNYLI